MSPDRTESGQLQIDWREFFDLRIEPMRQEMTALRRALEELSKGMVSGTEWSRLNEQCATINQHLDDLENRVELLEHHHSVGMWAFRAGVGIVTAVATAALISYLVQ